MKVTKRQRKKLNGMNHATLEAHRIGHKPPEYRELSMHGTMPQWVKVSKGVPYVRESNFTNY